MSYQTCFFGIIKVFISSSHVPSNAGIFEGELHRFHHKGRVATKLTRPQPTRLPCAAFHKLQSKPKIIPELKRTLQHIWDDLPQRHRQWSTKLL